MRGNLPLARRFALCRCLIKVSEGPENRCVSTLPAVYRFDMEIPVGIDGPSDHVTQLNPLLAAGRCPPAFAPEARRFRGITYGLLSEREKKGWEQRDFMGISDLCVASCGVFLGARGHAQRWRIVDEAVFIYCIQGHGFFSLSDRQECAVGPGDLLCLPPGEAHAYHAENHAPWSICWMHLTGQRLGEVATLLGLPEAGPVVRLGIHTALSRGFAELARQFKPPFDDARRLLLQGEAKRILALAAAFRAHAGDDPGNTAIRRALDLMDESLHLPFDLGRFAKAAGYSESHFSRAFKATIGRSPVQYFQDEKMRYACFFLAESNVTISEVAAQLGYNDPLYFSRAFKKHHGLSPERWRDVQSSSL